MAKRPLKEAGARILPPISDDGPIGEPCMAMRAPSPPEEPPAPKVVLNGLSVRPQRLLVVSKAMPACGMVVLT